jgi:hypothetical protein
MLSRHGYAAKPARSNVRQGTHIDIARCGIVAATSRERVLPMTESFEETYPRYDFAALVGFGLAFAGLVARAPAKQPPAREAAPAAR